MTHAPIDDTSVIGIVPAVLRVADRAPESTALIHRGETTSYRELVRSALAVATLLRDRGFVGVPIAVPAVRVPEVIPALLGVLMSGCAHCPIDPTSPADRQAAMIRAAGCEAALDLGSASVAAADVERLQVPEAAGVATGLPEPGPEAIAYILFTSGSTGQPKPVEVSHRAIAAAVGSLVELFEAEPSDRFLQFASLNWDTCLEEILPALTTGAALVFDSDAHCGSFSRILAMLARKRISVLNLPTAYWHEIVLYLADGGEQLPDPLRLLVIGGERINPDRLVDWRRLNTENVRLINTYGCTETVLVTHAIDLCGPAATAAVTRLNEPPIGKPMPHVRQYLEPHGDDAVLYIGGPSVARGYRGDPSATDDKFVLRDGGRYFRTGDLVRDAGDGLLTFHGRADRQLKIRGVRIDPAEVEVEILRHTDAASVGVIGVPIAGRTALVAFVVGDPCGDLTVRLLERLRRSLPAHLVPSRVIARTALPRTTSGKTDYARLTKEWRSQ